MSKKRKTRQQKETASKRHEEQLSHVHVEAPIYKISGIKTVNKPKTIAPTYNNSDLVYLRRDFRLIIAASGIIVALEILLFVLLNTNVLNLNFLGY
jgi:hypothetical protein